MYCFSCYSDSLLLPLFTTGEICQSILPEYSETFIILYQFISRKSIYFRLIDLFFYSTLSFTQSIIRVVFHDRRLQYAELEQLQQWRMGRPGERLLDIGMKATNACCPPCRKTGSIYLSFTEAATELTNFRLRSISFVQSISHNNLSFITNSGINSFHMQSC